MSCLRLTYNQQYVYDKWFKFMIVCLYHHLSILYLDLDFKTSKKISYFSNVFYAIKKFDLRAIHG